MYGRTIEAASSEDGPHATAGVLRRHGPVPALPVAHSTGTSKVILVGSHEVTATIPDSIWSKELLRLLLPELPRDDLPTEAMRLDLHPLDYAQLRWCARQAGCDVDGGDTLWPDRSVKPVTLRGIILQSNAAMPEGSIGVYDVHDRLLGTIQLGH